MKLIPDGHCYTDFERACYGYDAYGNKLKDPGGYHILDRLEKLQQGDVPFDVYSGWLSEEKFNSRYHLQAVSEGRWTAWARKK